MSNRGDARDNVSSAHIAMREVHGCLRALGALSRVLGALSGYLSLIWKHSETKRGKKT